MDALNEPINGSQQLQNAAMSSCHDDAKEPHYADLTTFNSGAERLSSRQQDGLTVASCGVVSWESLQPNIITIKNICRHSDEVRQAERWSYCKMTACTALR